MPCGYACFAYLGHVFALNAAVGANAEAAAFPQRDGLIIRSAVTPTAGFRMRSHRTRLSIGYTPSFSYTKDLSDTKVEGTFNQSSSNFSQRIVGAFNHQVTPQTTTALTAAFVTGNFDAIGLRQQLATTPSAGTPVTRGDFRSVNGNGSFSHAVTRRFSIGVSADTSLTETKAKDGASNPGEQNLNAMLLGNQFRVGVGATPSYLLTSRLAVQLLGNAGYQYIGHQQLLALTAAAGSSLAFSRTTIGSVSLGFARTSALPGKEVPQRFRGFNATAGASLTRKLSEGRHALGFSTQLAWTPAYDPISDRIRSRVSLNVNLTWKPARDWRIDALAQASTATDTPPEDATILINGRPEKPPDTRLSFGIPVTYTINNWSQLNFGVRANLPSPNLAERYRLLDPDYSGFVGISLSPLADRR